MHNTNESQTIVPLVNRKGLVVASLPLVGVAIPMVFLPLVAALAVGSVGLVFALWILIAKAKTRAISAYALTASKHQIRDRYRYETEMMVHNRQVLVAEKKFTFKALSKAVLLGVPVVSVLETKKLDEFGGKTEQKIVVSFRKGITLVKETHNSEFGLWSEAVSNAKKLQ